MDSIWALYGGCCFGLFKPSFGVIHIDEEVREYTKRETGKLKELLVEYEQKITNHK